MIVAKKLRFQPSALSVTLTRVEAMKLIRDIAKAASKSEYVRLIGWKPGFTDSKGRRWHGNKLTALAARG